MVIHSSLGRTVTRDAGLKNFTVQDESINEPREISFQEAQDLRSKIIEERTEYNKASNNEKRIIEVLIGIGRETEDVKIQFGDSFVVYTLQTLKTKESREVLRYMNVVQKVKTHEAIQDLRTITLCYGIASIDNIPFEQILGVHNLQNEDEKFNAKVDFVSNLDDNLSAYLIEKFNKLQERSSNKFSEMFAGKNTEEVKAGIAEAISKSV